MTMRYYREDIIVRNRIEIVLCGENELIPIVAMAAEGGKGWSTNQRVH